MCVRVGLAADFGRFVSNSSEFVGLRRENEFPVVTLEGVVFVTHCPGH